MCLRTFCALAVPLLRVSQALKIAEVRNSLIWQKVEGACSVDTSGSSKQFSIIMTEDFSE